jgi:hypothetical protein
LDPRTKWYDKIPSHEIEEALKLLKMEFMDMVRNSNDEGMHVEDKRDVYALMFEDLCSTKRNLSPTQLWNQEINLYQQMPRADYKIDPLFWWKSNLHQFPTLGELAKRYLAIPASQASCERLFSISKNDITETRTSMSHDLVESLLFIRKKKDILEMLNTC